jgi:oxygen-independent coproporphyrinogen-3 oxidase
VAGRPRRILANVPAAVDPNARPSDNRPHLSDPFGLYVHIPFCSAICNYCNFNRGLLDDAQKTRYVRALIAEIARAGAERSRPAADTIYFGGGTPSLLSQDEVAAVVQACRDAFAIAVDCEVTLEANPETVSAASLAGYREVGVNRLSFGVQSFRDDELRRLSRLHGADRARAAYQEAKQAGFDNVSLDLMMWLPAQQVAQWLESVRAAMALEPEHLSMYMLEVYPNAPLRDEMARASWSQAPDDDVAEMYERGLTVLEAGGYKQYEISNVAKPGRRSRHNLKYWSDGAWIGFGCGAHSTVAGTRWKNLASTEDYIACLGIGQSPIVDHQVLTPSARLGDALFTGLRLTDGLEIATVNRRYSVDIGEMFGRRLEPYCEAGLLEVTPDRWRLTRRGMLLAHEVMAVFV